MNKRVYFRLQFKRMAKAFPGVLVMTIITFAAIACLAGSVILSDSGEDMSRIKVGLVGDTEESFLGFGIYALEEFDSTRFTFEFIKTNKDSAVDMLENREIAGFVELPENFVYNVAHGKNIPAKYVYYNAPDSFGTVITNEIISVASEYVTRSQNAIYSMKNTAKHETKAKRKSMVNELSLRYIDVILSRDSMSETEIIGFYDDLSTEEYYFCSVIIFVLLLWGILWSRLLIKKDYSINKLMFSKGIKGLYQIGTEVISYAVFNYILILGILAIAFVVIGVSGFDLFQHMSSDISGFLKLGFKLFPVVMLISSMQIMMYELVSGDVSAVLVQVLVAIGLSYISGCFYPNYFFPDSVRGFADILPTGISMNYMGNVVTGSPVSEYLIGICIYILLFILIGTAKRNYNVACDRV